MNKTRADIKRLRAFATPKNMLRINQEQDLIDIDLGEEEGGQKQEQNNNIKSVFSPSGASAFSDFLSE